jgi:simple sugar transport system ATP-binding protein
MTTERDAAPLLEARGLTKRFGRVQALHDVSFTLGRGEVMALLGDNGAGKSTLIRILSGVYGPSSGSLSWKGDPLALRSPRDAHTLGISTVYQDLAVVDLMSVYRNMFLGREEAIQRSVGPFKVLDRRKARREALDALDRLGIRRVTSADVPVLNLSGGERQCIAIARAVYFSAELLILDEPVSALSLRQTQHVLDAIAAARERGLSVIVISHNIHHVYPVADRFMVLDRGTTVAEFPRDRFTKQEIAELVIGAPHDAGAP